MRRLHLLAFATLLGCSATQTDTDSSLEAPPQPPPMIETRGNGYVFRLSGDQGVAVATIEGGQADVFQALVQAYDQLEIEIGAVDPARRVLQSEKIRTSRRYAGERMSELFHCGRTLVGDRADTWRLEIEITSQVRSEGRTSSTLSTRATAFARTMDGTSTNPVPCTTRGILEERIAATTALLLATRK